MIIKSNNKQIKVSKEFELGTKYIPTKLPTIILKDTETSEVYNGQLLYKNREKGANYVRVFKVVSECKLIAVAISRIYTDPESQTRYCICGECSLDILE